MQKSLAEILKAVSEKPPRSKLEPHYELVHELRRRSKTYREIAQILHEHVGVQVDHTTICDFVRVRARRPTAQSQVGQLPPRQTTGGETQFDSQKPSKITTISPISTVPEETAMAYARIEQLKHGEPATNVTSSDAVFHYDEGAPLRLVPEKDKGCRRE